MVNTSIEMFVKDLNMKIAMGEVMSDLLAGKRVASNVKNVLTQLADIAGEGGDRLRHLAAAAEAELAEFSGQVSVKYALFHRRENTQLTVSFKNATELETLHAVIPWVAQDKIQQIAKIFLKDFVHQSTTKDLDPEHCLWYEGAVGDFTTHRESTYLSALTKLSEMLLHGGTVVLTDTTLGVYSNRPGMENHRRYWSFV